MEIKVARQSKSRVRVCYTQLGQGVCLEVISLPWSPAPLCKSEDSEQRRLYPTFSKEIRYVENSVLDTFQVGNTGSIEELRNG